MWYYLAEFLLKRKMYETKSSRLCDNVGKCVTARQATNDSIIRCRKYAICIQLNYGMNSDITAFPRQQWFRERGPMLRYTYIACHVYVQPSGV